MSPLPPDLTARWTSKAHQDLATLSEEERSGVHYFLAATTAPIPPRIARWLMLADRVQAFVQQNGALPSEGARARRLPRSPDELTLARFLSRARFAIRRARINDFQLERLVAIRGFENSVREEAWLTRLTDLETFVATRGRAPRRRSQETDERSLATFGERTRREGIPKYIVLDRSSLIARVAAAMNGVLRPPNEDSNLERRHRPELPQG